MRMQLLNFPLLVLLTLSILIGCSPVQGVTVSCPSLPSPPQGAEDLVTGKDSQGRELDMFQTNDTPESILAYYKDALLRIGWKVALERADGDRFSYPESSPNEPCLVDILTSKAGDGRTKVVISVIANGRD